MQANRTAGYEIPAEPREKGPSQQAAGRSFKLGFMAVTVSVLVLLHLLRPQTTVSLVILFLVLFLLNGIFTPVLFLGLYWLARLTSLPPLWYMILLIGGLSILSAVIDLYLYAPGDNRVCRTPVAPRLSFLLSFHVTQSLILDALYLTAFESSFLFGITPDKNAWSLLRTSLIIGLPLVAVTRFWLAKGTIRLWKRLLDYRFRIVLFRRFSSEAAPATRKLVAPMFGAYGRIVAIHDATLQSTASGPNPETESLLGETSETIYCDDSNWKERVRREVGIADLVVFHWPSNPTDNMTWEYYEARNHVPLSRMVWVCHRTSADSVRSWLHDHCENAALKIFVLDDLTQYSRLRRPVYELMARLIRIERPCLQPPK